MRSKKILYLVSFITILSVMGCYSLDGTDDTGYISCNATSRGNMAESENGFFYVLNEILYYADKDNINNWVPVCNKPDCSHGIGNTDCNAYVFDNMLVQQEEKLYGVMVDYRTTHPYVYQVLTDGSGSNRIYDIPIEENIWISGFKAMLSQEQLVFYYKYIDEKGRFNRNLVRLEDENLYVLYTDAVDEDESVINMTGSLYWGIRGDNVIISSLLTEEDSRVFLSLWDVDGEKPVRVNIPEEASLLGTYISDDTFRYFQENEGFYEVDLESGEKTLISENQLENSRGYILTDKYMIECNRYVNYKPEEAYLKFYNGEQWLDVTLPEEVKNSDDIFSILSVASDRIFVKQSVNVTKGENSRLYYFMLEDENPELIFCEELGAEREEEIITTSSDKDESSNDIIDIEDIIVFDTEDYFF